MVKSRARCGAGLAVFVAVTLTGHTPHAAPPLGPPIRVNSTSDVMANDGNCTLREAIIAANTNTASGSLEGECRKGSDVFIDRIVFTNLPGSPDVYQLAIPPAGSNTATSGDLNVTGGSVKIIGNDQLETIIDGGSLDRIFATQGTEKIWISDVTLRHGRAERGGAISMNGSGRLEIRNATIRSNEAFCDTALCVAEGGGIFSLGAEVAVFESWIFHNTASCATRPLNCTARGGGIRTSVATQLYVENSLLQDNLASCAADGCDASGGGISNSVTKLELYQSTVLSGNGVECDGARCTADGGGIYAKSTTGFLTPNGTIGASFARCTGFVCESRGGGLHLASGFFVIQDGGLLASNITTCGPDSDGCGAFGGGVYTQGYLRLHDSIVYGSEARSLTPSGSAAGGGIFVGNAEEPFPGAYVEVYRATISDNAVRGGAAPRGGGVFNVGHVNATHSTIAANVADGADIVLGGGISNHDDLVMTNVTVSGNVAVCASRACLARGGGVYNAHMAQVAFTTIAYNGAACALGECSTARGGGVYHNGALFAVKNSIIAHNAPGDDCKGGGLDDYSGNFNHDGSCGWPQYLIQMGPLGWNGGPTKTHALLTGNLAIDGAVDCQDVSNNTVPDDQRGSPRPQGATCDAGAYERFVGGTSFGTVDGLDEPALMKLMKRILALERVLTDSNRANDHAVCGQVTALLNDVRRLERAGTLTPDRARMLRQIAAGICDR